jgi:benzoyl-CoA reductase/2-hydroxyglutaryl-CoA dehydratase subunit BcrC/BadD/HgdB
MNDIGVPMSDSALNSATSLERAFERLARAVDHLEHAIEAASDRPAPENGADLEAARSESVRLRETHELVAEQLNSTIARLRGVLGG